MKRIFDCFTVTFSISDTRRLIPSLASIEGYTYYPHENHAFVPQKSLMRGVTHFVLEENPNETVKAKDINLIDTDVPILYNTTCYLEQPEQASESIEKEKELLIVRFSRPCNYVSTDVIIKATYMCSSAFSTTFERYSTGEYVIINAIVPKDFCSCLQEVLYDYTIPEVTFDNE